MRATISATAATARSRRHFVVNSHELLITSAAAERMKRLIEDDTDNISTFPPAQLASDIFSRFISVERLASGSLEVVDTDENLIRLLVWTNPEGINMVKVPVWISADV